MQPVGQKRLTNVAVVRLKKQGLRFEIACYKNSVLSWRSKVEKDIDEVLQSHTVYANVSKGVLAKSKDLTKAFGTDDAEQICLEILEKGELQVAGKEREVQLSNQFRDIATIAMEKTVNPETQRPYTISMIERLMREVHFAVDPHTSSKKQALELIRELEKTFPIARARMRLRLVVPSDQGSKLLGKLEGWNSIVEQSEEVNALYKVVCQVEPGHFRECDAFVRDSLGRLEVVSMAVQKEGDGNVEDYADDHVAGAPSSNVSNTADAVVLKRAVELPHDNHLPPVNPQPVQTVTIINSQGKEESPGVSTSIGDRNKQLRCNTCNAEVGNATQYREHFKSDWHKHNLKRKVIHLPPLSSEEWLLDTDILDNVNDLNEYCH